MITGINHINIAVQDIDISFKFYKEVMGFKPLCKSEGSAYFLAGSANLPACVWFSLDLDREKKHIPASCNSHIAFSVSEENFYEMSARILASLKSMWAIGKNGF